MSEQLNFQFLHCDQETKLTRFGMNRLLQRLYSSRSAGNQNKIKKVCDIHIYSLLVVKRKK